MYFHTAYFKFTTLMKIFIIIFCNKIEEEKLWVYLFFGCVVIESISTGWKILLKLLIWPNIKVLMCYVGIQSVMKLQRQSLMVCTNCNPIDLTRQSLMVHMQLPKCDGLACESPMVLHRFIKNKVVSIYLMQ